jgi:endonuclease YncB( thermonuclease family)
MKLRTYFFIMWLGTTALFFQSNSSVNAQAQARAAATNGDTPAPSTVTRDRVNGLDRITGNVKVLNAHLLVFNDGTEVDLNGGIDAPELDQQGRIGGVFYPCGKEAAEFLRKLIGERKVSCFVFGKRENRVRGDCFVGETLLELEMVRNGWAVAHHEGMEAWQAIAREKKRGLWRGEFVPPERWRKGERLPGES